MDPAALRAQRNTIAHWIIDEHCLAALDATPAPLAPDSPPAGPTPADRAVDLAARSLRDQEQRLLAHHAAADRAARDTVLAILLERRNGAHQVDFYGGLDPFGAAPPSPPRRPRPGKDPRA